MIRSMTAFARQEAQHQWDECDATLVWEIRTVNHRYLEPSPRLPDHFRALESQVRRVIGQHLKRGKIDCTLRCTFAHNTGALHLNESVVQDVLSAATALQKLSPQLAPMNTTDLLNWPDVLQATHMPLAQAQQAALSLLEQTIQEIILSRQREGAQLKTFILQRCQGITQTLASIEVGLPNIIDKFRHKLTTRLNDISTELDPTRLEQETVILLQKMDVMEEIDRLKTHLNEVQFTLNKDEPIGRRLDFLMQELHREANTLSAKSIDAELTQHAIDIKVLIEQMREQVQNIE